jgi:hypothetical protein
LEVDPKLRLTVDQALQHPWIAVFIFKLKNCDFDWV